VSRALEVNSAVERLIHRVEDWTPSRWAASSGVAGVAVHALAQRLADLEAAATGREGRPVPRLANDLALVDQLRVLTDDLVLAKPPAEVFESALAAVTGTNAELDSISGR
jgi:hypothetical protein